MAVWLRRSAEGQGAEDKVNFFSVLAASVEGFYCLHRMDAQDTNKFSPFLQNAKDGTHDAVVRVPEECYWPRDLQQGKRTEDSLLRSIQNSHSNYLQNVSCPHCPWVFPRPAHSIGTCLYTHTHTHTHT
jgi:hypothetical protein